MVSGMLGDVPPDLERDAAAVLDEALRALGAEVPAHASLAERRQALKRATSVLGGDLPFLRCTECDGEVADAVIDAGVKRCPYCMTPFEDDEVPAGTSDETTTTTPADPGEIEEAEMATQTTAMARRPAGVAVVIPPTKPEIEKQGTWTRTQCEERVRRVEELKLDLAKGSYALAVELKEIRDKGIYTAMHDSWDRFVTMECRISAPWANTRIRAVEAFQDEYNAIGEVAAVRLLRETPAVQKKWVAKLKSQPMTKLELEQALVGDVGKRAKGPGVGGGRPKVRLTFEEVAGKEFEITFKGGKGEARMGAGFVAQIVLGKDGKKATLSFHKRG